MSPRGIRVIAADPRPSSGAISGSPAPDGGRPACWFRAAGACPGVPRGDRHHVPDLIDLVSTRFLNADNQLQLETPTPDCNPDMIRIAGLDEPRLSRMLRLIRLQRRVGWPFAVLDRALVGLRPVDLDTPVLEKLTIVQQLAARLDRPVAGAARAVGPIDTWGKDNEFDRLFATRAVAWRTQDERTFQLRSDRTELAETGPSLDPVASALLAAFRITSEELAIIRASLTRRGAEPRLDLAGLSAIYRVVVLARALQLRIPALDLLLRLTPPEADPFRPGDPAATRRFVEIVREVQASDFTPERLAYLFRHEAEPRRDPAPLPAQVDAVLANIRRGLADAFSETSHPAEVTGDMLRQKLGMLLDAALLDPAIEALDPRTPLTLQKRREFFDRHLAKIFADPAAAASRLFESPSPSVSIPPSSSAPAASVSAPPVSAASTASVSAAPAVAPSPATAPSTAAVAPGLPATEAEAPPPAQPPAANPLDARWKANINLVLDHLLPQLRTRQLRGAVIQSLSDTLGLSVPSTARLLDVVLRSRQYPNEPILRDFLALLGTGLSGAYFGTPISRGEPAATRLDPEIAFAWVGAPPTSRAWPRFQRAVDRPSPAEEQGAAHVLHSTDGAVRLDLTLDDAERVLIDQPSTGRVVEHASEPVALDPRTLASIRLEYRNQGGPATVSLQFGTGPVAKEVVPTTSLYPADGLSSFAPGRAELSSPPQSRADHHRLRHDRRAARVADGQSSVPESRLLADGAGADADGVALMRRWRQLAALYALRKKLPQSNVDLFDVFAATAMPQAIDRLVLATGWDRSIVEAFLGADGFAIDTVAALRPSAEAADEP